MVKKELIEITRQKELLFLMFVSPVIQIVILGYVISTDIRHVPVGIVNLSRGQAAARVIERVRRSPLFDVRLESNRSLDYLQPLKKGDARHAGPRDPDRVGQVGHPEVQALDGIDLLNPMIAAGYFNAIIKQYILDDR
jgi:ABC-2 type transport system permease protein